MNKAELAAAVAERVAGADADARRYVDAVFDTIMLQVAAGERVQVTGFGTFDRVERAARAGRNPQTGEPIDVPAGVSPRFHAGQTFRVRVTGSVASVAATVEPPVEVASRAAKPAKEAKAAKGAKAVKAVKAAKAVKTAEVAEEARPAKAKAVKPAKAKEKAKPAVKEAKQKPAKATKTAKTAKTAKTTKTAKTGKKEG